MTSMKIDLPKRIGTLLLRRLVSADAVHYHALQHDSSAKKFLGKTSTHDLPYYQQVISELQGKADDPIAVVQEQGQTFLGYCGFIKNADIREMEIHIVLFPKYWKKGFGTELGRALVQIGFNELKFSRLIGVVDPANTGSIKILSKLGMKRERVLQNKTWNNGHYVFTLTQDQFLAAYNDSCSPTRSACDRV